MCGLAVRLVRSLRHSTIRTAVYRETAFIQARPTGVVARKLIGIVKVLLLDENGVLVTVIVAGGGGRRRGRLKILYAVEFT